MNALPQPLHRPVPTSAPGHVGCGCGGTVSDSRAEGTVTCASSGVLLWVQTPQRPPPAVADATTRSDADRRQPQRPQHPGGRR